MKGARILFLGLVLSLVAVAGAGAIHLTGSSSPITVSYEGCQFGGDSFIVITVTNASETDTAANLRGTIEFSRAGINVEPGLSIGLSGSLLPTESEQFVWTFTLDPARFSTAVTVDYQVTVLNANPLFDTLVVTGSFNVPDSRNRGPNVTLLGTYNTTFCPQTTVRFRVVDPDGFSTRSVEMTHNGVALTDFVANGETLSVVINNLEGNNTVVLNNLTDVTGCNMTGSDITVTYAADLSAPRLITRTPAPDVVIASPFEPIQMTFADASPIDPTTLVFTVDGVTYTNESAAVTIAGNTVTFIPPAPYPWSSEISVCLHRIGDVSTDSICGANVDSVTTDCWTFSIGAPSPSAASMMIYRGWNLISMPVIPTNERPAELFDNNAILTIVTFDTETHRYLIVDHVEAYKAYFVLSYTTFPMTVNGFYNAGYRRVLAPGWTMFGATSGIVDAANVNINSTMSGPIYGFDAASTHGYVLSTEIVPGQGYLVITDGGDLSIFNTH